MHHLESVSTVARGGRGYLKINIMTSCQFFFQKLVLKELFAFKEELLLPEELKSAITIFGEQCVMTFGEL